LTSLVATGATECCAAMPAATVMRMATRDGASALGLDAQIGSLEPGKCADAIAVDLGSFEQLPCYDPSSQLLQVAGRDQVSDVWLAGERLFPDPALTHLSALDLP